jgi:hypothetical protein
MTDFKVVLGTKLDVDGVSATPSEVCDCGFPLIKPVCRPPGVYSGIGSAIHVIGTYRWGIERI